jgi:hypothetical protein
VLRNGAMSIRDIRCIHTRENLFQAGKNCSHCWLLWLAIWIVTAIVPVSVCGIFDRIPEYSYAANCALLRLCSGYATPVMSFG